MNLAGKTAIVTGASRGLGPYIAKTLALKGVKIIALARDLKGLEKTKLDVQLTGQKCNVVSFDLTQINELDSLVNNICEECKKEDESVSQNLILTSYKLCSSCRVSKTIFPI